MVRSSSARTRQGGAPVPGLTGNAGKLAPAIDSRSACPTGTRLDAEGSIASPEYGEWAAPLYPFNLSGHPAISVPAGFTADSLPIGLQLIGPWFAEHRLLHIASVLEQMLDWRARRPPI